MIWLLALQHIVNSFASLPGALPFPSEVMLFLCYIETSTLVWVPVLWGQSPRPVGSESFVWRWEETHLPIWDTGMGSREHWCLLPASWNKFTCKNKQSRLGPEEWWLTSSGGDSAIPTSSLHKMQEPARPLFSRLAWLLFPLLFTLGCEQYS